MDPTLLFTTAALGGVVVLTVLGGLLLYARCYRRVPPGHALVVTAQRGILVARNGALVFPIINQAELIDLTVRALDFEPDDLVTKDNQRVNLRATLRVKVSDTVEDIEKVARSIGCARAADPAALRELFGAAFASSLATIVRQFSFDALLSKREEVAETVMQMMSHRMDGYAIDDVAIDRIVRAKA